MLLMITPVCPCLQGLQKNALVGGALTGATVSLAQGKASSMDIVVQAAITGGAIAMAAQVLNCIPLHKR